MHFSFFFQLDQELSADDRKQKHVSFDSSSLMRSQTLATMDEASFQRMAAVVASQTMASSPSKSSERLIDGRKTPEFELYSQIFPPELARQIMMGKNDCLWKTQCGNLGIFPSLRFYVKSKLANLESLNLPFFKHFDVL